MRRSRRWMVSGLLGMVGVLGITWSQALAQPNNDDITATATVLTPVTVTAENDLDFGNVFPGVNSGVGITDGTSGRWLVNGESAAEVSLAFTLPTDLTDGTNLLPIVFGAGDAGHHTSNDATSATAFDPSAGATTLLDAAAGELYVWIGGTVQPAAGQPAGVYTETITLTVNYTGS